MSRQKKIKLPPTIYNSQIRSIRVTRLVGHSLAKALRDHFIFNTLQNDRKIYDPRSWQLLIAMAILKRVIMYVVRNESYYITNNRISWHPEYLKIAVWGEYILECRNRGMTTGQICIDTGKTLTEINSYA